MKCPVCKKCSMNSVDIATDLTALTCRECSGVWFDRDKYDAWRAKHPADLPETNTPAQLGVSESHKAKICPQCGHLMLPYRIGHGLSFSVDYCGACGGVWCDRGEWDAIKAKNLHHNLHDIVSQHWQTTVRESGVQESIEQTYARHLGANYTKAQEVRTWLHGQPQKALILAYLTGTKPEDR